MFVELVREEAGTADRLSDCSHTFYQVEASVLRAFHRFDDVLLLPSADPDLRVASNEGSWLVQSTLSSASQSDGLRRTALRSIGTS